MTPSRAYRLTGRHVLIGLLAFFGVVSAVNGVFLYLAMATHPGLDTKDSYRRGIAYNKTLSEASAQHGLGWRGRIGHDTRMRAIEFSVERRTGRPVDGLVVSAELRRPVHDGDDRRLTLAETAPGIYRALLPDLRAGQWVVHVTAHDPRGQTFQLVKRISVE